MSTIEIGLQASGISIALNVALAVLKTVAGITGNSNALIADGIESSADVITSVIVLGGLHLSAKPADDTHPYGHGKAESMAGIVVSLALLGAAVAITIQSITGIMRPHDVPEWYTLLVLALVIVTKESMFRYVFKVGDSLNSSALKSDAWHHRSDMFTSLAAFVGIMVAIMGGKEYAGADDWAALLACALIFYNGFKLLKPALDEIMDAAVPAETEKTIRKQTEQVAGVLEVEKCRVRKSGVGLIVDIHIMVDGTISVTEGHRIAHDVKDTLLLGDLSVMDVSVHVEPRE